MSALITHVNLCEHSTCYFLILEIVEYRQEHAAKRRKLNSGADDTCPVEENGELLKLT